LPALRFALEFSYQPEPAGFSRQSRNFCAFFRNASDPGRSVCAG
jgi:hypothetical protein